MADRGDTHYRVPHLNLWFAGSALVLLIASFWMVLDDWSRPWKHYQREFRQIEVERARTELAKPESQAVLASEAAALEALAEAERALESQREAVAAVEEEIRLIKGEQFVAVEGEKFVKQNYNFERWGIEEHRIQHNDPTYAEDVIKDLEKRLADAAGVKEEVNLRLEAKQAELTELLSVVSNAEKAVKDSTKSIDLVRAKLEKLAPEAPDVKLAEFIRDFPGLDFIGPNLKVQKTVLADLTFELNFLQKPRIDMCKTCHLAADLPGYDEPDLQEPYRSHPRLDLFLTAKSPHPMSEVGCTICHRGAGEMLDFIRSDHRPSDEEEAERWHEDHHWHKQHHWDYPMLRSNDIEASCTQCHKTSMELIADDAPQVTEGFRNFERFGCYACHKVDWFPTKRRPGPSLKGIKQKVQEEDWIPSWVARPRDFRPSTWMPQVFHLENYAPEEQVVVSEYGSGRPILGQEWNDAAVAAVSAFVWDRADDEELDPIPVEGDPVRGLEVFRVSGCLACHNLAPYEGEEPLTQDLAHNLTGENEHGPNLRGVASKVTPEWLYWWIKDPAKYWPETRMPDLRLSDQDAADIAAYMLDDPDGTFHDVPDNWTVTPSTYDRDVLKEQARWFFNRDGREVLKERFEGEWSDDNALLVALGEKLVLNQGCHSCHEIKGLEDAQGIGAELTNWSSKTVDKLDWGAMADVFAEEHGWTLTEREAYKKYREPWLAQKLHAPRSFDRKKVKNPTEKLRMPWFDFSQEEIDSIGTFVFGLVDDEVQRAKMEPTPAQASMNTGLQAIRQHNCAACHDIQGGTVTFEDEDGVMQTVTASLLPLEDATTPPPMTGNLDAFLEFCEVHAEDYEVDVDELGMRLLDWSPGVGDSGQPGENVFIPLDSVVSMTESWGGDFVKLVTDYYMNGVEAYDEEAEDEDDAYYSVTGDPEDELRVQDVDGEFRAYYDEEYDKIRWTFAPPVLWQEGHKLQKSWFYEFLQEPMPLREQMRVRMPSFNFAPGEAGAIADYFAHSAVLEWPARYARQLRILEDLTVEEVAEGAGLSPKIVSAIEAGDRVAIQANLPKLLEFAQARGFDANAAVDPNYERIVRRSPNALAHATAPHEELGGRSLIELGELVAREGPACYQCHFDRDTAPADGSAKPIAWAPDLSRVRERLREDWVYEWLWNPALKYPGTSMPGNFDANNVQYLEQYPNSTSEEQIQAVMSWLYNMDRSFTSGGTR